MVQKMLFAIAFRKLRRVVDRRLAISGIQPLHQASLGIFREVISPELKFQAEDILGKIG